MIPAGQLRNVIDIKEKTSATGPSYGGQVGSYSEFQTEVRVKEIALTGRESARAGAQQAIIRKRYQMRFIPGLKESMKVIDGTDEYEIVSIMDVRGMGRVHDILVKTFGAA